MLIERYLRVGKTGRPVRNSSETLQVTFGLGLIQMELDERHKILSMSMWTRYVSRLNLPYMQLFSTPCSHAVMTARPKPQPSLSFTTTKHYMSALCISSKW